MKRLDTKEGQYGLWLGLFIGVLTTSMGIYIADKTPTICSPSVEHQEVMSGINDIKQAFCNGDGCRLDYETYKENN